MLIDRAIIDIRSGRGGDGHVSFRREKFINKGGPSGGDGGNGGSVILLADDSIDTLTDMNSRRFWHADNGEPGAYKQKHGATADDLTIRVPVGTLIYDADTDALLVDLDEPGKTYIAAKGGRGGFGNEHFKSPTNQTPMQATPGEPGEERTLRLELKLIADVGLVGKPNAGKSTLLSRLSKARPKIADYPFTTLSPNLGIAELPTERDTGSARRLVIADIPGLIEGASHGHGLGHEFLRHVERTRLLVHLVEIDPTDESDPVTNYRVIQRELADYSDELANKPQVLVLSKIDLLPDGEDRDAAVQLIEAELGMKVMLMSAVTGEGLPQVLEACWAIAKGSLRDEGGWRE